MRISGAVAHTDEILAGLQDPGGFLLGIRGHIFQCKGKLCCLAFTRSEKSGLLVCLQLLIRFLQSPLRSGNIYLDNFFSGIRFSGVGDPGSYFYAGTFDNRFHVFDGKIRVAFSVTEAVMRLNAKGVKITITHIDAVGIVFIINISVVVAEALGGRIVGICFGPGIRQFSGWNLFARKHICHA